MENKEEKVQEKTSATQKEDKKEERNVEEELLKAKSDAEHWKNEYYKAYADMANLRKQIEKDHRESLKYRIEGFDMFDKMVNDIKHDVVKILLNINRVNNVERKQTVKITSQGLEQEVNALKNSTPQESKEVSHIPVTNEGPKVGRNDPCPCRQPVKNIKIVVVNNVLKKGE